MHGDFEKMSDLFKEISEKCTEYLSVLKEQHEQEERRQEEEKRKKEELLQDKIS